LIRFYPSEEEHKRSCQCMTLYPGYSQAANHQLSQILSADTIGGVHTQQVFEGCSTASLECGISHVDSLELYR